MRRWRSKVSCSGRAALPSDAKHRPVQLCAAEPEAYLTRPWSAPRDLKRELERAMLALAPSLRAQRCNPRSFRGGSLDCFAALAMTEVERARHTLGVIARL